MAKIRIIDDDVEQSALLSELLTRAGHVVSTYDRIDGAMESLEADKPDLLVLDLNLPGMGGLEICRTLRADPAMAGLKILMLTGQGSMESVEEGFAALADDYVVKPFSLRVLAGRVNQLLAKP